MTFPSGDLLLNAQWNGTQLKIALSTGIEITTIALDVDGYFFTERSVDSEGQVTFDFPFSPARNERLLLQPRRGRGGQKLTIAPWVVQMCKLGFSADNATDAYALIPPSAGECLVPLMLDCTQTEVVIIVPIYNAPDALTQCIESLLSHTSGRARLVLIDDASPDPQVAEVLACYIDCPGITVLRNERNLGFTATVNKGISLAGAADVVLLNADTQVGPNWLTGLRRAAYSDADIGTVTAVSDNAGAFSVPELEHFNPIPENWSFTQTARMLWQHAGLVYPALPTGNGFCLYIRSVVLEQIGLFDAQAFPQGYGEENDFCQRAEQVGFRHIIAGNILVRHVRSASFGDERREALGKLGMNVLRTRYPRYEASVGETLFSFERRVLDWRVRRLYAEAAVTPPPYPRVLMLVESLNSSMVNDYECWTLLVTNECVELYRPKGLIDELIASVSLKESKRRDQLIWSWLQRYAFEIVDIGHTEYSIHLSNMATKLGIPTVRMAPSDNHAEHYVSAFLAAKSFVRMAQ